MALPRHASHRAAHRAAWWTAAPNLLRPTARLPLVRPTALLAAACALVAGSVTQATANQIQADNVRHAEILATEAQDAVQQVEVSYHARLDEASTARLSAQATAYLAGQRTEARNRALDAIQTAGQLTAAGTDVLSQEDLAELDQAVADLTNLLATTPDAKAALNDAVTRAGTAAVEPTVKDVITVPVFTCRRSQRGTCSLSRPWGTLSSWSAPPRCRAPSTRPPGPVRPRAGLRHLPRRTRPPHQGPRCHPRPPAVRSRGRT